MSVAKKVVAILLVAGSAVTAGIICVVWTQAERSAIVEAHTQAERVVREVSYRVTQSFADAAATTVLLAHTVIAAPNSVADLSLPSTVEHVCIIDENGEVVSEFIDAMRDASCIAQPDMFELAQRTIIGNTFHYTSVTQSAERVPQVYMAAPFSVGIKRFAVVTRMRWSHIQSLLYRTDEYDVRLFSDTYALLASTDTQDRDALFTTTLFERLYPDGEEYSPDRSNVVAQYTHTVMPDDGLRFITTVSVSREIAVAQQLLHVQQLAVFAGLLLVVCALAVIELLYGVVMRPLRVLTHAIREYTEGHFEARANVKSKDEFGVLAHGLHTMADHMSETQNGLEELVTMRTQQLQEKIIAFEHTQQSLQEEKAKDEALLASITDAIIVIDTKGIVLKVNTVATQLLDQHDTLLIGRAWRDVAQMLYEQEVVSVKNDPSTYALQGTVCTSTAYALRTAQGKTCDVACSAAPIFLRGSIVGAMIVLRDITHEREIERTKTEFVTLASHQLRTPLSAANWYAELLLSGEAGKMSIRQKEYVQEVYAGIQRMIRLVNALLQLSTFEMRTVRISGRNTVALADIIQHICAENASVVKEKKLKLSLRALPKTLLVAGDGVLVSVVVQAVIDNAVQYTPANGSIRVRVYAAKAGEVVLGKVIKSAMVILEVRDTGYGIPQAERMHIGEKFYRASNVKEHSANGNGISLYLAQNVIKQLSGAMWFESTAEKGTTFVIGFQQAKKKQKK